MVLFSGLAIKSKPLGAGEEQAAWLAGSGAIYLDLVLAPGHPWACYFMSQSLKRLA